jgi:hypothetical protein
MKVETFVSEVDRYAGINEFAEVGPIAKVSGTAVYLVDYDPLRFASAQSRQHL